MRGSGKVLRGVVFIAAALGVSAAAFAQADPQVPITFRQFVPKDTCPTESTCAGGKVSQSRIFDATTSKEKSFYSQVTYRWTLNNFAATDLNRTFFTASLSNPGGSDNPTLDEVIIINSLDSGYVCRKEDGTAGWVKGGSSINCFFGTLPAKNNDSITIYMIVNVPGNGSNIEVAWRGGGYEGNGSGCCQPGSTYKTAMVDNTVDQSYKFKLDTFVKKEGTELFTGDSFITVKADPTTTYVKIPQLGTTYDTAKIVDYVGGLLETSITPSATGTAEQLECRNNKRFTSCFSTDVSIPKANFGTDPNKATFNASELLNITLRVDSSVIRPSVKIENVTPIYIDDLDPNQVRQSVSQCVWLPPLDLLTGLGTVLARSNLPCWNKRFEWSTNTPGYTPDLKDLLKDFQWDILHFKNGRYNLF